MHRLGTLSLCFLLLAEVFSFQTRAHHCGETQIIIPVGEACLWRIIADRTEKTTDYTPFQAGPAGVAEVTPRRAFKAHHGDFVIRGLAPGTNDLVVTWFYPGPPPAGAVCTAKIIVTARTPGQTSTQDQQGNGQLVTAQFFRYIEAETFRAMLDEHVPAETPKLLLMSQCFAGNMAQSPFFKSMPNTAIGTGNSPNQEGRYGGYHDDVARALKPATNKTASDVHEAGVLGRHSIYVPPDNTIDDKLTIFMASEFPTVAGGLALSSFSLEPVSATGAVRSRHVVVYAGSPSVNAPKLETHDGKTIPLMQGKKTTITDNADRETIKQNFANEPNTTVTTAGGEAASENPASGQDGWDFPGTAEGAQGRN